MNIEEFVVVTQDMYAQDAIYKAERQFSRHSKIAVSISGGADSDIMFDLTFKVDKEKKAEYIFMNTGLEYEATKRHLQYLEEKYGVKITKLKATKPIPLACKKYGLPFLSKRVSEMISRLQKHGFKWEDEPFEVLLKKYPKCKAALKWWCNGHEKKKKGGESSFNVAYNTYLKEFLIQNPPSFAISPKCCTWAKKHALIEYINNNGFDLSCVGIRKAEGGARSTIYKNCYSEGIGEVDQYRPLFWFDNNSKAIYEKAHGIRHSDCYEVWGMKRTGCAGCPFGKDFEQELELIQKYEPKLFKAVINIFGASYEYTRKYREFQKEMKERK